MFVALLWSTLYFSAAAAVQDNDNQPVGWKAGNDYRGTWDITSTCLSTIFACTWSIQHPNVPGARQGKWSRRLHARSVKWMIITILFPELIVIHASFELAMALQALRLMEQNGRLVEKPWWLQRPSLPPRLLKCLGFSAEQQKEANCEGQSANNRKWTLTHCYFANMGGLYYEEFEEGQISFPMTALQLAKEPGLEDPMITEEEIEDKSKSDCFAKIIASLGFLQLALSLIVRTSQGLAFSQLETITLVFAVCGVVIYLLYLYKPQNVEMRMTILDFSERNEPAQGQPPQQQPSQSIPKRRITPPPRNFKKTYDSFWDILTNESGYTNTKRGKPSSETPDRIPNDNIPISESSVAHPGVFILALASGLFGAMHAIAWNFEFPSTVERLLWQTATVVSAGSPFVGLLTIPFTQWTVSAGDPQLFAEKCLRLMREYSWHVQDKGLVNRAYEKLEESVAQQGAHQSYASIFLEHDGGQTFNLGPDLLEFLKATGKFSHLDTTQLDLHTDSEFIGHFERLDRLLRGEASKKLMDTATTNTFPRKNLLPRALNLGIVYVTGLLYFLSRISLLAVGFSSLRRMPESVYISTPWTAYIPTLSSS